MTVGLLRCGVLIGAITAATCGGGPQAPGPLPPAVALPTAPPPSPTPAPAPHPFDGTYAMTLTIGSSCAAVPDAERVREYTARFDRVSEGNYVVSLSEAMFLSGPICDGGSGRFSGIGCHQFFAHDDGSQMQLVLANNNDEAHGGHIVERTSSGTWLEIIGEAVGSRNPAFLATLGQASVWRCGESHGYPFPCFRYAGCQSELRMTLTRK